MAPKKRQTAAEKFAPSPEMIEAAKPFSPTHIGISEYFANGDMIHPIGYSVTLFKMYRKGFLQVECGSQFDPMPYETFPTAYPKFTHDLWAGSMFKTREDAIKAMEFHRAHIKLLTNIELIYFNPKTREEGYENI